MIRSPMIGCSRMCSSSSSVSGPVLRSTSSRMPILPTSCSRPARYRSLVSPRERLIPSPSRTAIRATRSVPAGVAVLGVDGRREALDDTEERLLEVLVDGDVAVVADLEPPDHADDPQVGLLERAAVVQADGHQPGHPRGL